MVRLRHIRSVLPDAPGDVKLLLFSRSGFTPALAADAAASSDVELVDLTASTPAPEPPVECRLHPPTPAPCPERPSKRTPPRDTLRNGAFFMVPHGGM
ncbi:hypothetical protein FsymDg_1414 [Candidatus Protofrankia datiscae]|uniref:Uncharacterized protein n=1 Tax=Candidatus Protofrankia datiscae TaxID=2716812 RepID=F8B214_9ACTN|nr:hypothetical protein FsymDg_1414 [Candidatus Protofrankia datiscae]